MGVRTYLSQFYPDTDHRFQAAEIETSCLDERCITRGKRITEAGWKVLFPSKRQDSGQGESAEFDTPLPTLSKGPVQCLDARVEARRTKPPVPYTEGTLIKPGFS